MLNLLKDNNKDKVTDNKSSKLMCKNFVWNTVGSTLYVCTSLFFMIIVTRINGVEQAGIFTFGFSFACMIQVIALFGTRTYQVTERDVSVCDSDYVIFKIITCLLMLVFSTIFVLLRGYDNHKVIIMLVLVLYKCLDAFSEVYYGIFQNNDNLYQVGISFTLKATVTTAVLLIVDLLTQNLILSCFAFFVSDIVVFISYDCRTFLKYNIKYVPFCSNSLKKLFVGGLSVCVFTLLSQYLVNIQKYVIDFIQTSEFQAIFGMIVMPATFMSLCTQLIINPFLKRMNDCLKNKDYFSYSNLVNRIIICILFIGLFALILCFFVGIPVLEIIYGINLNDHLLALLFIVAGSVFFGVVSVLSNALIAIRKNKIQIVLYLFACFLSTIVSIILVSRYAINGASIAYFSSMLFLCMLYYVYYLYSVIRVKKYN